MPSIDRANVDMGAEGCGRALEVATPDCIADNFDGEVVVLNIASGVYFSLRDLAGAVWRDLESGHLPSDLVAEIGAVDAQLTTRAREFIAQIEQHGLMRPRETGGTHPVVTAESVALARNGHRGYCDLTCIRWPAEVAERVGRPGGQGRPADCTSR